MSWCTYALGILITHPLAASVLVLLLLIWLVPAIAKRALRNVADCRDQLRRLPVTRWTRTFLDAAARIRAAIAANFGDPEPKVPSPMAIRRGNYRSAGELIFLYGVALMFAGTTALVVVADAFSSNAELLSIRESFLAQLRFMVWIVFCSVMLKFCRVQLKCSLLRIRNDRRAARDC
jgi:hypothetical protein